MVFFSNSDNGMLLLDALLSHAVGGDQPAAAWLDYESYDAPKRVVQNILEETIREKGIAAGLARYRELKQEYPAQAFEENMLNALGGNRLNSMRIGLSPVWRIFLQTALLRWMRYARYSQAG